MPGALAHSQADQLRAALEQALRDLDDASNQVPAVRDALLNLLDVLESSDEAVIMPADTLLTTQHAAEMLGVSRMTVVRLADRGVLAVEGTGTHRRIRVGEVARYRAASIARRRANLDALAGDIDEALGPDQVVPTR
ncbi:helix-turn-helix domain-containing protein [Nocardioides zhouii]|uniref:DNA-binding protein n=1 Tax=Nocardioides zhouii TaxID=1168729 RepID=A0A4Q2SI18_9ACTN|nr:helix-turn-helix domain-containing protein [Nocardioides zhouii]RYC03584.1 DNA-binding protein [Nocardioides zhouii]